MKPKGLSWSYRVKVDSLNIVILSELHTRNRDDTLFKHRSVYVHVYFLKQ